MLPLLHLLGVYRALTDVNAKHAVLRETQQDISSKYVTTRVNYVHYYVTTRVDFVHYYVTTRVAICSCFIVGKSNTLVLCSNQLMCSQYYKQRLKKDFDSSPS